MANLAEKFTHIKGWGVDADPENEPTYPMKDWTGDDHKRLDYERAPQQPVNVEKLHSNERPGVTRVFGSTFPPSGLSGSIRRFAFRYSEGKWAHWLALVAADRVNMIEGIVKDLGRGHVPNFFKEAGWGAVAKHDKKEFAKLVAKKALLISVVAYFLLRNKKGSQKASKKWTT